MCQGAKMRQAHVEMLSGRRAWEHTPVRSPCTQGTQCARRGSPRHGRKCQARGGEMVRGQHPMLGARLAQLGPQGAWHENRCRQTEGVREAPVRRPCSQGA